MADIIATQLEAKDIGGSATAVDDPKLCVTKLDYDTDDISEYNVGNILPVLIIGDKRFIGEVKEKEIVDYLEGCNL